MKIDIGSNEKDKEENDVAEHRDNNGHPPPPRTGFY